MDLELLLARLQKIRKTADFTYSRDDARKAYHLLKKDIALAFEQSIFKEKLFHIEHSILMENKEDAFRLFKKALVTIISIIDGSVKEFKKQLNAQ